MNRLAIITATAFLITGCGSETSVEASSSPAERTVPSSSRSLQIHKGFFESRSEVLDDLKASGFWPTTVVSGPSPGIEMHWHSEEVHGYVIAGETSFLDGESGARHIAGPGDKIIVPARTLHAEGEIRDRVVYIIAVPEAMVPDEFLKRRPPEEL